MPPSRLFFFTGENDFALRHELQRWRKTFVAKHGPENLLVFSAKDLSLGELLDGVETLPFIAEKRLVILEGVPRFERTEVAELPHHIHPQTILAIVDPKPDKRLGAVKELEKVAEIKRFDPLGPAEIKAWLQAEIRAAGLTIQDSALMHLLETVGSDEWALTSEVAKLASYTDGTNGTVTREAIDTLVIPSSLQVVWKLADLIGSKRAPDALTFLRERLDRGEDPYGIWIILLTVIKNLVNVYAALESGVQGERAIASATGMYFLAVRSVLPLACSLNQTTIKQLTAWVAEADCQLKTGGYRFTAERPEEVIALSEQLILSCG